MMPNQKPKYKIGDQVWKIQKTYRYVKCPVCNGTEHVRLSVKDEFYKIVTAHCPYCNRENDYTIYLGTQRYEFYEPVLTYITDVFQHWANDETFIHYATDGGGSSLHVAENYVFSNFNECRELCNKFNSYNLLKAKTDMVNSDVNEQMRSMHFQETGMYSSDRDIIQYFIDKIDEAQSDEQ